MDESDRGAGSAVGSPRPEGRHFPRKLRTAAPLCPEAGLPPAALRQEWPGGRGSCRSEARRPWSGPHRGEDGACSPQTGMAWWPGLLRVRGTDAVERAPQARTAPAGARLVLSPMLASGLPERGAGLPWDSARFTLLGVRASLLLQLHASLSDCSPSFQLFFSLTVFCISASPSPFFRAHAPSLSWVRLVSVPYSGRLGFRVHRDGSV